MKDFFAALTHKVNKVGMLPVLILSLCSVVICSLMYVKTLENNRLLLELLGHGGVAVSSAPVNAGDTITIRVSANRVENMYGYSFKLNYDESALEYIENSGHTAIADFSFVFPKQFDGYLLVGATMVGPNQGFTGQNVHVLDLDFKVLQDGPSISITEVNVVGADLAYYDEGVSGWTFEIIK